MFKNKEIIHIVVVDENIGIGRDNKLLYSIHNDIKYFRDTTLGHSLLCGRNTYDSFPKPLDRRIIRDLSSRFGDNLADGLQDCWIYSNTLNTNSIYIIGGASIYNQTSDIADELLVTIVDAKVEADTYYTIPNGFVKVWESETQHSVNGLSFKLTKWKREEN